MESSKIKDIASLEKGKNLIKKAHINTLVQIENIEDVVYESVRYDFNQETSSENIKDTNEISSEDSSNKIKQKTSPFITIKQNYMKIPNTAPASLRFDISPAVTPAIESAFLQDLIKSNYLTPKMANLACDPKKFGVPDKRLWLKLEFRQKN